MPRKVLVHLDLNSRRASVKVYSIPEGLLEREVTCENVASVEVKGGVSVTSPPTLERRYRVLVCELEEPEIECSPPRVLVRERRRATQS